MDKQAEKIWNQIKAGATSYARRSLGHHDAEEVEQDIRLMIYNDVQKGKKFNSFEHQCRYYIRKGQWMVIDKIRKQRPSLDIEEIPESESNISIRLFTDIKIILEEFPPDDVVAKVLSEYSYRDIEKLTGLSKATVSRKFNKFKKRIQAVWEK